MKTNVYRWMFGEPTLTKTIDLAIWAAALVVGLFGLWERLTTGHLLADYGSYVPWGIWVTLYFFGAGLAGGVFILGAAGYLTGAFGFREKSQLRRILVLSTAALLPALLGIGLDLGRMEKGYRTILDPSFESIMIINTWLYLIFIGVMLITWLLSWRSHTTWVKPFLMLGIVVCVAFALGSGLFFSTVTVKPGWSDSTLPLATLASAIATGSGLLLLLWPRGEESNSQSGLRLARRAAGGGILIYFLFQICKIATANWYSIGLEPARVEFMQAVPSWWIWVFGGGLPLLLLFSPYRSGWRLAGLLAVLAFFWGRMKLVLAGQAPGEMPELVEAFQHQRLVFGYDITAMEWRVVLLLVAFGVAIYVIGGRLNTYLAENYQSDNDSDGASATSSSAPKDSDASRRRFISNSAVLGAFAPFASLGGIFSKSKKKGRILVSNRADVQTARKAENILHTVCLQCNTGCGIKCKLEDGVITKIDGNPYSPWTMVPHLPYTTPLDETVPVDGAICPKGQSGLQTAYDPYRLRKVLKRAGKRGENKWITIPFERAVREVCEGGRLFEEVAGEENSQVKGLDSLMALREPEVAQAMAADVEAIWNESDPEAKKQLIERFKQDHSAHLDKLIDPEHPDLGPKNNQILLNWGRIKGGRSDFYKRFARALGTVNAHGHTTVCQGALYFACTAISEQYTDGKFSGGKKFYWQADTRNSRFILFVGANIFEANYGPTNRTVRLTENLASGRTRIAVADPRFTTSASKAWKWLPLNPGGDIPLAMAIMRWMFTNETYNKAFLANANKAAAQNNGETSWSNAGWLVRIEDDQPKRLARAGEVDLAENHELLIMVNGQLTAVDPNDEDVPLQADLFVDTVLADGSRVKSALQILRDSVMEHTIEEWCEMAGVNQVKDVTAVARELSRWGNQAAVDIHRGPAQHTNGFYAVLSWMSINMLLGNFDHKGGMIAPATWDVKGKGGLFDMNTQPGAINTFGISSIRHDIDYEKTTLFNGYPAKRNWYPLASDVYQEVVPSIEDAYPYSIKCLFTYMQADTYSLPAGHANIKTLCDLEKLPLHIANDILIGMTSMYADYIFPDLSFLERWEFQGSHANIPAKVQPVRQPVMAPIPAECEVYGERMPLSFESMMLGIAEQLDLPGFGTDGLGEGMDFKRQEDFYLRMVANLAFGESPDGSQKVPNANARELEIFNQARRHLPETVFDMRSWKNIVGSDMWDKVVYVLNRGGRFQDYEDGYQGEMMTNIYGKLLNLYQEKTAETIHAGTGLPYPGYAASVSIQDYHGHSPDTLRSGYDLNLITSRTIFHTKTRTITNPWLSPLMPENGIQINPEDASRLGLHNDDQVKVVSATNPEGEWPLGNGQRRPMIGKVIITPTVRPGVINFYLGFGHWATGAEDVTIDNQVVKGEARRGTGINANAAMWLDPQLKNTCMFDPIGGSVSFYDTRVKLIKV